MNVTILVGNLGSDPETRYTQNQTAVCNFTLATSKKKKDNQGNWNDHTEWHKIVVWGKQAESAGKFLSKGKKVGIQGELQTRKWDDKSGVTRYQTEIHAHSIEFLSPKDNSTQAGDTGGGFPANDGFPATSGGNDSASLDDIPF